MIWVAILLVAVLAGAFTWATRPICPCSTCGYELLNMQDGTYYCDECCCDRRPKKTEPK